MPPVRFHPHRLFRIALAVSLSLCPLLFFLWSWRWPLVGDASLMHYIGFLIERGWAPYRDLGDMNMPGSYLVELAAMHLFGMGDLAWRCFDFTLLATASASFFAIASRTAFSNPSQRSRSNRSLAPPSPAPSPQAKTSPGSSASNKISGCDQAWLAGLFSASLFILIHGRDGLAEAGQRDLTMAVCLIAATAFLFLGVRGRAVWPAACFGLFSGVALTIKPTTLPLTVVQLALAIYAVGRGNSAQTDAQPSRRSPLAFATSASIATLIAPAIVLAFLLREHALTAFLAGFGRDGAVTYYAGLGHRPLGYILLHSISPLLPLDVLWLAVVALNLADKARAAFDWECAALLAGVLFGLANCILQARALPYYRYPLLVFLLPLMALDFTRALYPAPELSAPPIAASTRPGAPFIAASPRWVGSRVATKVLATLALAFAGFFLAPQSAILIHRYRWWETDFITSLEANLNALGGAQLSHRIQCIDTNSGCGNVLYRMRLEPTDGVLSDFFLFGPGDAPILRSTREHFLRDLEASPPRVLVVTSHLYLDELENYGKLSRWPAFAGLLASRYTLQTEWSPTRTARWWSREETPVSYRIYVLRP
jgi:hypothetical protein